MPGKEPTSCDHETADSHQIRRLGARCSLCARQPTRRLRVSGSSSSALAYTGEPQLGQNACRRFLPLSGGGFEVGGRGSYEQTKGTGNRWNRDREHRTGENLAVGAVTDAASLRLHFSLISYPTTV